MKKNGEFKTCVGNVGGTLLNVKILRAQNRNMPFYVSAPNDHTEIMQFLLAQEGIDKNRKNNEKKTSFYLAAKRGGTNFSS